MNTTVLQALLLAILSLQLNAVADLLESHVCGTIQLPEEYTVLQYTSANTRLSSNGIFQCSCSGLTSGDMETVDIVIVDEGGRRYAPIQVAIYPCLSALCVSRQTASDDTVTISHFDSVEILPRECNDGIMLNKTNDSIEIAIKYEIYRKSCGKNSTIIFSNDHNILHQLSDNGIMSSRTLNIRRHIPIDMDSCADVLKQDNHFNAKVILYNVYKKMFSVYTAEHVVVRRDNTPPSFFLSYYSEEIIENSPVGTSVTTVQADDIDSGTNGELTYTMEPLEYLLSANYFEIHSTSGEITTKDEIDREMMSEHTFIVTATDGGGILASTFYTITVIDENDNSPIFTMGNHYTVSLFENQNLNEGVLSFTVTDDDDGINSEISFSLENNTDNIFSLNIPSPSISGIYTSNLIVIESLDYENVDFYQLTIIAQDGGTPVHSVRATVDLTVCDVVDNPPMFSSSEYTIEVPENTDIGTTVFQLNATILDSPSITVVTYHLYPSQDFKFSLNFNTGAITVHSDLDYELGTRYSLLVGARTAPDLETTVSIIINIININDNGPDFILPVYDAEIMEGTPSNYRVLTVRATDDDEGIYGVIRYHIAGNITSKFHLNSTTGEIFTLAVLDYETRSEYSFEVVASDGGNPARLDQVAVTIQVIDLNDELPVFLSLVYNMTILENSGPGVLVADVEAEDADSTLIEYYLVSVELRNLFLVDLTSGHITTRESLNRENVMFYTLEISASDGQLSSEENARVYVTVADVNDRPPLFTSGYSIEISELLEVNSTVLVVEAFDEDEGINSEVTYSSETLPEVFSLTPDSGAVTLVKPLDYEDVEYYSFLVWARDGGEPPQSSSANVAVSILDENDNAPEFLPGPRTASIRENSDAFVPVLHLSASDIDSGSNGDLEYSIIGDNSAIQAFSIDDMGVIKTRRPLDREEQPLYSIVIEVRDMGTIPLSSSTTVEIEITDEIDSPPIFSSIRYYKEISVVTPASTPLITVTATTQDNASPSSILYGLTSAANRTLFRIDQRSGVISAASNINPSVHEGKYIFLVTAQHHHLSATATVVIDIIQNTTIPRLKSLSIYTSVFAPLVSPLTALGAITLDRVHRQPITFSLDPSDPDVNRYFSINSASGVISVTSAVRRGHYKLNVLAASVLGTGSGEANVYIHTISNITLENTVVVEFESGSEIHFVSVTLENFAAALTEIVPCSRDQVELIGIQETSSNGVLVAFAVRELDLLEYIPRELILDRLLVNEGSSRLDGIFRYGSEVCTNEPCPNFQQCSPVVHVHHFSNKRSYKVLQSSNRIHISHPFSQSFTCHCPPGNDLKDLCGIEIDLCTPSPCQFDAPCHNLHNDYICECPPYTGGKNCSLVCPSPSCTPCIPDMCLHGSKCIESDDLTSYSCESCPWPSKYRDKNCELTSLHFSADGYAAFPSLGSVVKTRISFRFVTVLSDGVMVYIGRVSGSHDMLSVDLVQGQIRVTLSLGDTDELVALTTDSWQGLNDGEWHVVDIMLDGLRQWVTVTVSDCSVSHPDTSFVGLNDGESCVLQGKVATRKKSLDVNTMLYIGGVESHIPLISALSLSRFNFVGCLANLVIDDRIVDLASPIRQYGTSEGCPPHDGSCDNKSCPSNGKCVPVWNGSLCHCEEFPECDSTLIPVSFSNGYIQLQLTSDITEIHNITLAFRSRQAQATLIKFGSAASIKILDGLIVYSINNTSPSPHTPTTLSPLTTLTLHTTVNDGLWHTITMTTETGVTQLSLDSGRAVISSHHTINLSYTMNSISLGYDTMNGYYEGCLAGLTINDHQISLSEAVGASNESNSTSNQFLNTTTDSLYYETETIGVEFGCGMGSKCSDLATPTCPANSVCIDEWRSHSCVCDDGLIALEETGECVDPCDPNPCQNGGSCIAKQDGPKCMCVEGYTGPTCIQLVSTSCPIGHYGPPDCKPCYCHLDGVTENVCDSSGRCFCNSSLHVFSPPDDVRCQPCDCNMTGSLSPQCLPSTGECLCRNGVTDRQCDVCMEGYAGMNEHGCKEAVVVSGLFSLKTVTYNPRFDREGSSELTHFFSIISEQLKVSLEWFALFGEQEVAITNVTNSSSGSVVLIHYKISSYSPHDNYPLPSGHIHTLSSVLQSIIQSGWLGLYQIDTASHILLTDCSSCGEDSRCIVTSPQQLQPFACDTCPNDHTLDGIICRKITNGSCTVGLDIDRDCITDTCDNCPYAFNPSQDISDCVTPNGMCPIGHSDDGVLWNSVPENSTATAYCASPYMGYANRECLVGGIWSEVDSRDCVSIRSQQFIADAESIDAGQVMNIYELHYSLSDITSYTSTSSVAVGEVGVSGGDLRAVGRYLMTVVQLLVKSAYGPATDDHRLLLELIAMVISNVLSPDYTNSWLASTPHITSFPLSHIPHTLELTTTLFHIYQSRGGVSLPHLQVKTILNTTAANISNAVMYMESMNGTTSSIVLPADFERNSNTSRQFDIVVGSYPTLYPLLSPSPSIFANMSVVSVIISVKVWSPDGITIGNLPSTPIIITLAHARKVYVYSQGTAKCVIWQDTGPQIGWSSSDCEVTGGNTTHTTCACYHLSTFAVLLPTSSLSQAGGDGVNVFHPGVFTYVALSLSCLLLLLTTLALWIIRWSSGNVFVTVYKNLVLSLLLTALLFIIGIDRTEPEMLCSAFAVTLDFLLISCLFWILVVGVVIARLLLHPPPKRASCLATIFMVLGLWTIPCLMCVIPVGVVAMSSSSFSEDFGYPNYCLIAPEMVLVLLTPITLVLILIIISLIVVLVLLLTLRSNKGTNNDTHIKHRTRRHLAIITMTLSLYLISWGAGLLTIYGHEFSGPVRDILEITFAISYTALSVFIFITLALNKKIINSVRARFESKYQNSSILAVSGSSSLISRLGRYQQSGDGNGLRSLQQQQQYSRRSRQSHRQSHRQLIENETRIEVRPTIREPLGELNSVDLASMEANPRTPNTEPLYSQIKRPSATRRGPMTATAQWYPRRTSPRGGGNIQPSQPVSGVRSNLLNAPGTSSGGEADLDTDDITSGVPAVEVEQRPWYHSASELQHEQIQSVTSTDIDYPHISSEENDDDDSRIDPSGISTTSNDNTIINEDTSVQRMEEDLNNVWLQQDQQRHQNEQAMQTVDQASDREREEVRGRIDEEQLATALQNRLSSPQPSVDPMWYRRGSGCEETGNMPTPPDECELQKSITTSPQKTVTWADQEPVVLSPRHSCESFSSQSICLEPPSASSSQQTSREGSPVMEQDHTPVPRRFSAGFVGTPPLLARRPAPEGMGAIVMFPSPHRLRKTSSGSLPPLSPTSLLSSNSSQCSGVVAAAPPPRHPQSRGVGQASIKPTMSQASHRLSSQDYHCNGPSAQRSAAAAATQRLIRHNPDGSKTLQSLV